MRIRIDPGRVQILDASGAVVAPHPVPERPTRLPDAVAFLDGLTPRLTRLTPIPLHALERRAMLYGEAAVRAALAVAARDRHFNAHAIERSLRRAHPTVVPEPALAPLAPRPAALGALDDVDPGAPRDSTRDSMAPTGGTDDGP